MKFLAQARRHAVTTATIISFSLTFALAGIVLLMGLLPQDADHLATSGGASIETGIVLLVVPLVALVAAILFEAGRLALRGPVKIAEPRSAGALSSWKPGHGEG